MIDDSGAQVKVGIVDSYLQLEKKQGTKTHIKAGQNRGIEQDAGKILQSSSGIMQSYNVSESGSVKTIMMLARIMKNKGGPKTINKGGQNGKIRLSDR